MNREITVILKKAEESTPSSGERAWRAINEFFKSPFFTFIFGASFGTVILPWLTSVATPSEVLKLRQKEQEARADAVLVAPFISSLNAAEPDKFRASSAALRALNEASKASRGEGEQSSPLFTGILEAITVVDNQLRPPAKRDSLTPALTQQINSAAQPAVSQSTPGPGSSFASLNDAVIYIQTTKGSDKQLKAGQDLRSLLQARSLVAPGVEEIDASKMPDKMQVRYFHRSDERAALALAEVIGKSTKDQAFIVYVDLKAQPGTLEVWFPKAV